MTDKACPECLQTGSVGSDDCDVDLDGRNDDKFSQRVAEIRPFLELAEDDHAERRY